MSQGRTPNPNPNRQHHQAPHRDRRKVYLTFEARSVAILAVWTMAISGAVYGQTGRTLENPPRPDKALLAAFVGGQPR